VDASWDCVFLARQGGTEWNLQRRRQGQLGSALTAKSSGVEEAHRHTALRRPSAIDGIFGTPGWGGHMDPRRHRCHLGPSVMVIDETRSTTVRSPARPARRSTPPISRSRPGSA